MLFNLPAGRLGQGRARHRRAARPHRRVQEGRRYGDHLRQGAWLSAGELLWPASRREDVSPTELEDLFVHNLSYAARKLEEAGIRLLIEAINTRDIPGFFLNTSRQALKIIDRVGSKNLCFQYDIYHMQVMEGDLARTIEQNLGRIAHIQLADNPGRHEPGTGEINYPFLYEHLDRIGYTGWIGAEYKPSKRHGGGAGVVQGIERAQERGLIGSRRLSAEPLDLLTHPLPQDAEKAGAADRQRRRFAVVTSSLPLAGEGAGRRGG